MTTLPDLRPPDQTQTDWHTLDDLLTSLRESLRILDRQGPTEGLKAGIDDTIKLLAAGTVGQLARRRLRTLAQEAARAAIATDPADREPHILAARTALTLLDMAALADRQAGRR